MIGTFKMYSPPWLQYVYYNSKVVSKLNVKKCLARKFIKVQFSWKFNVLKSEHNILKPRQSGNKRAEKNVIFVHPCHKKL